MAITKDMSIVEIVQTYPDTVEVLMNAGMGCLGCAAAHFENIEQGAMAHGIDIDALIAALPAAVRAGQALDGAPRARNTRNREAH